MTCLSDEAISVLRDWKSGWCQPSLTAEQAIDVALALADGPCHAEPVKGEQRVIECLVCAYKGLCKYVADPYEADVNNTILMGWWCDTCYRLACDEI